MTIANLYYGHDIMLKVIARREWMYFGLDVFWPGCILAWTMARVKIMDIARAITLFIATALPPQTLAEG